MALTAERGVGQEDVGSPTNWNAVFDILLVALSRIPNQLNKLGPNGELQNVQAIGFADDLLSAAGSIETLQKQADIVSIFAMIFGLEIAHSKLRTLSTNWSGSHWYHEQIPPILVHRSPWSPVEIQIQHNGQLKLL